MAYVAAVASGIDEAERIGRYDNRLVVMRADKEIHPAEGFHEVQTLALKL